MKIKKEEEKEKLTVKKKKVGKSETMEKWHVSKVRELTKTILQYEK
jgi:hypothetical protein